jgi:hypothetical protein
MDTVSPRTIADTTAIAFTSTSGETFIMKHMPIVTRDVTGNWRQRAGVFALAGSLLALPCFAGSGRAVVTLTPQPARAQNLAVTANGRPARVTGVTPLAEQGLQLWILIDDGSGPQLALQYPDIAQFIRAQPSNTEVGVGYMRYGSVQKAQDLTVDHDRAAKALRVTLGRAYMSTSPFMSLTELMKKWPQTTAAREVLMITSGIDPYSPGPQDPYLDQAIDAAQRAGVVVHSIYFGPGSWRTFQVLWGQNNLQQMADATGGHFYWLGTTNPVSFRPLLNDLNERLSRQYVVTFASNAKPGLERIRVTSENPNVKIAAPARVEVG